MSTEFMRVPLTAWHDAIAALASEGFGMLMAVDQGVGRPFELWFRSHAGTKVVTTVSRDGQEIVDSITDIFAAALSKEREVFEFFGIRFSNNSSNEYAIFEFAPQMQEKFPLRKDFVLERRDS